MSRLGPRRRGPALVLLAVALTWSPARLRAQPSPRAASAQSPAQPPTQPSAASSDRTEHLTLPAGQPSVDALAALLVERARSLAIAPGARRSLRAVGPLPPGRGRVGLDPPLLSALERELGAPHAESPDHLRLSYAIRGPHLELQLVLTRRLLAFPLPRGVWRGRVRLDAGLRRYLAAPPTLTSERVRARSLPLPVEAPIALRGIDLDDDGREELVVVDAHRSGTRVLVGRLETQGRQLRFRRIAEAPLPELPLASLAPRRPLATLGRSPGGELLLQLRRFARSVRVRLVGERLELTAVESGCPDERHPLDDGCAATYRARDYFSRSVLPWDGGEEHQAPASHYARARQSHRLENGLQMEIEAATTPRGRLVVRMDETSHGIGHQGAALALADVDGDEDLELLGSADGSPAAPAPEELRLTRVVPGRGLRALWSSPPLEGRVLLASSIDLAGDGLQALLALEELPGAPGDARLVRLWVIDAEPTR